MDTLCNAKKLQAMNNYYYYYKIAQFLYNIIFNLLIAFTFSTLFCSYPYWFPFLKKLVFDFSFSPKFLFVVVNVIVVFLVGESKLIGSNSSSSPTNEIYDEYVERSRNLKGFCFQEKTEQSKLEFKNLMSGSEEKKATIIQDCQQEKEVVKEVTESSIQEQEEEEEEEDFKVAKEEFQDQELEVDQEEVQDQEIEVNQEEVQDQEDEEIGDGEDQESELPAEELNRRVEEFIARVNKQWWLEEARLLVCCSA